MDAVAGPKTVRTRKKRDIPGITRPMTYEEYLAAPEEMRRYDIIDGWKIYRTYGEKKVPNPTVEHQEIQGNLYSFFRSYVRSAGGLRVILSPCDVLVHEKPTRTRQPDILIISDTRFGTRRLNDPSPLSPAPELVVEILSPSDTRRVQQDKLSDYLLVDVHECWLVNISAETVEVLKNTDGQWQTVAAFGHGQMVTSTLYPGLTIAVDDIFETN